MNIYYIHIIRIILLFNKIISLKWDKNVYIFLRENINTSKNNIVYCSSKI